MAVSVTISSIEQPPDGRIKVRYSDGLSQSFLNLDELKAYIGDLESVDNAMRFILARGVNVGNDLANTAVIVGKTLTLDVAANNVVSIK